MLESLRKPRQLLALMCECKIHIEYLCYMINFLVVFPSKEIFLLSCLVLANNFVHYPTTLRDYVNAPREPLEYYSSIIFLFNIRVNCG